MQPLMDDAQQGNCEIIISEVSVAEVARLEGAADVAETVEAFLANSFCRRFPVTASVSAKASGLIRAHSLDTCDAIILATALVHRAQRFYTHDGTMRKRIRASQNLAAAAATSIGDLEVRSPLWDEDLCRRAGLTVGEPYRAD